ncbi:Transcriptional regulator [Colletotrichum scovillei]|nr:Transcriptional regulator [Colletotrichum scovillei]
MPENGKDVKSEAQDDKEKRDKTENNGGHAHSAKSPKKRRKVNHACVYCRRSERPCTRCIKRNIGHLCHDEPRDADSKKAKSSHAPSAVDESETTQSELTRSSIDQSATGSMGPPPPFDRKASAFGAAVLGQGNPLHLVSPGAGTGMAGNGSNMNQFAGFSDAWLTAQNHYHDMQSYHPNNYLIAPEVTHEFNLLNDFLQTSLLDDGGIVSDESQNSPAFSRTAGANDMLPTFGNHNGNNRAGTGNGNNALSQMLPPQNLEQGKAISRPGSIVQGDKDKAREYYLQAADPSGNDTPEERMDRVLKAKYEAGLLKPFNYVKGYARLGTYLDGHIAASSKQKILRTIDRFRPKFREKAQALTDMELLYVEMWFEKQLMEYDRVFASMAVPACCWRRTGEIFRGNNEMAELLHVPVENLRDGKISLHEILTEESLVRYWEEFGTIAFDPAHDTLLTACTLKNPDDKATDPVSPKSNNTIDKINSFATFSQALSTRLPSANDTLSIDALLAELNPKLETIIRFSGSPRAKSQRVELDKRGTELWNLCTRQRRDNVGGAAAAPAARKKLLLRSRTYAFFMISVARGVSGGAEPQLADVVHVMKLALKAGKTCLDDGSTSSSALKLAETAWKTDNFPVMEFMYSKGHLQPNALDPSSAEKMTEILFEIGKDLSKKEDFGMAVRWLERGYDIINAQDLSLLSRDAIELRLSVCQALIHALLGLDTPESSEKALDLVSYIESEIGEKPVVLLLRLELLQKAPAEVFDIEAYADILRRMVRSFNFSEAHFKLLVHHARKLHDKSPTLATSVVDGMLRGTIVSSGREEWVERLVLLRIWMETTQRDGMRAIEGLMGVLTGLQDNLSKPFGASTAVGALTLIWKKIEANYNQGHFDFADGWCQIALQPLFQNGGPANMSRLGRKLILCALGRNDAEMARQVFHSMSEAAQNEPMTRYLMYKAALRSSDQELAAQCLERVALSAAGDPNFLYACVLEAQQAGDRVCAMQAMKQLVEKFEFSEGSPIHLPALLRCNIRLAVSVVESEKGARERQSAVEEILVLFEGAVEAIQRGPTDKDGNRLFTVKELDWFCQNAYNLGLKHSDNWDVKHLIRLYNSCLTIAKHYPEDLPAEAASDLALRTMFCDFIAAAALISLARTEDNVEQQLQHYLVMRRHVVAYNAALEKQMSDGLDTRLKSDLTAKLATLMVFDFEAAIALKKTDELGFIIRTAVTCRDELEKMKGDRLAKYIRCMFHAVLPLDAALGQRLMKQAVDVARDSRKSQHPFPAEELEWLVTVGFNQAVDAYNVRQDDECNTWADLALNLAHYADDGGVLEKTVQENRMKLKFDLP